MMSREEMISRREEMASRFQNYVSKCKAKGDDNLEIFRKVTKSRSRWNLISDFEVRFYIFGV